MTGKSNKKTAVVLFNLGGPDSLESVKPFLFNLFYDRAIINLPNPLRYFIAKVISSRREPVAQNIYKKIGGKSPLLENTQRQASALEKRLQHLGNVRCFIAMRYWHPFAEETVEAVKTFDPDKIVLLPLYPQFSTTTTGSSLESWRKAVKNTRLETSNVSVGCFPTDPDFIRAHCEALKPLLKKALHKGNVRLLFTAHGLPEKIVAAGDPYAWQVEETVASVVAALGKDPDLKGADYDHVICYQSRVGPMKWLGPSTEDEIIKAGAEGKNLVVVPIAFVSEHSETLVELDIKYQTLANDRNVGHYSRVPALGTSPVFIDALAGLVRRSLEGSGVVASAGPRICPDNFSKCPCEETA